MSITYLCDKCRRSFDTKKGLLAHTRTVPHYKFAQSFVVEEQNNMKANQRRERRENIDGKIKINSKQK